MKYVLSKAILNDQYNIRDGHDMVVFGISSFEAGSGEKLVLFCDTNNCIGSNYRMCNFLGYSSRFHDYENAQNPKREIINRANQMMETSTSSYRGWSYVKTLDIETLLYTDNMEDVLKKCKELDIHWPDEYKYDTNEKRNLKIINNSSLDDVEVMDIVDSFEFTRIEKAFFSWDCHHCYGPIVYNSDDTKSKGNFYADKSFTEWYKRVAVSSDDEGVPINNMYLHSYNEDFKTEYFTVKIDGNKISFKRIGVVVKIDDDGNIKVTVKDLYHYYYDIINGSKCIKKMVKGDKEVSTLEMFNINSKTIHDPAGSYIFNGSLNVYDFFLNNSAFFDKCGFSRFISNMNRSLSLKAVMVLYMAIIHEYPQIELLVKMGHEYLVEDFFSELISSTRKDIIEQKVKELNQLIDKNSTKGSMVLRFPSYIGDYLRENKSKLSNYLFWRDMYEIENISKENFEKFLSMPERAIINLDVDDRHHNGWYCQGLQEIVKYPGYSLIKTVKYIVNQGMKVLNDKDNHVFYSVFRNRINILKDTLRMAEELNIEVEPYPDELMKIHNEIMVLYENNEKVALNVKMAAIGEVCKKEIDDAFSVDNPNVPSDALREYTYVFPTCQADFTQEGINQHNCVGSYFHSVLAGNCVIFFVRKKDDVESSYITAEIRKNTIGQVMYSNNRPVPYDSTDYKYCLFISNRIQNAFKQKRIDVFDSQSGILGH